MGNEYWGLVSVRLAAYSEYDQDSLNQNSEKSN